MAYVFVQKDKHKKLEYLPDYHSWIFYNPVTKRFVISECAELDECAFPIALDGRNTSKTPLPQSHTVPTQPALSGVDSDHPSPAPSPVPAPFLELPAPPPAVAEPPEARGVVEGT